MLRLSLLFMACLAFAKSSDEIKSQFSERYPEMPVDAIEAGPIKGTYALITGPNVFYLSEDGTKVFSGDVIEFSSEENITETRRAKARLASLAKLPEKAFVTYAAKAPKATITVFTDTSCGYCREFHKEVAELNKNGITVRYLGFPRTGPETSSWSAYEKILCHANPAEAMAKVKANEHIPSSTCENHLIDGVRWALMVGINSTPTIIMPDGAVLPGMHRAPELIDRIIGEGSKIGN